MDGNIINVEISRLKDYENNPRNNETAVEKVAASIKRFGFLFPIVIDINNVIVCGHTRKKACQILGIKEAPCIKVEHLTPEQVDYFRLVDNRTSEYARWNLTKLESALNSIDLKCDRNSLIVKAFDLETERASLDTEMTEIKLDRFNFLGYQKDDASVDDSPGGYNEQSPDYISDDTGDGYKNTIDGNIGGVHNNTEISPNNIQANKPVIKMITFECGQICFIISQVELDMLNAAYLFYLNNIYPKKTFIEYLLENAND